MVLHVVGLPHTNVTKDYLACAYTQKVLKFARMMAPRTKVIVYGGPRSDPSIFNLECVSDYQQRKAGFNGPEDYLRNDFDPESELYKVFHKEVIHRIGQLIEPGDVICTFSGEADRRVAEAFPKHFFVEAGIGYSGVFANFRIYESTAWMHATYGPHATGSFFHEVIPNYFEIEDFTFGPKKDDYFLYVGRLIDRKGWRIAQQVCKHIGARLIVAGPGHFDGYGEYAGVVGLHDRAMLLAKARAVFAPTLYIEPFGGTHVEAMLSGTPVITTPWGAYSETFRHGSHGFKCYMFEDFIRATERVDQLKYKAIRDYAIKRYSTRAIAPKYEDYFRRLQTLQGDGWYTLLDRPAQKVLT